MVTERCNPIAAYFISILNEFHPHGWSTHVPVEMKYFYDLGFVPILRFTCANSEIDGFDFCIDDSTVRWVGNKSWSSKPLIGVAWFNIDLCNDQNVRKTISNIVGTDTNTSEPDAQDPDYQLGLEQRS
jgi:hypothetical protein